MCIYMYMHKNIHMRRCLYVCRGQRPACLSFSITIRLKSLKLSFTEPGTHWLGKTAWPVNSRGPLVSASPVLGLQVSAWLTQLYWCVAQETIHTCMASTLLSHLPSPGPSRFPTSRRQWDRLTGPRASLSLQVCSVELNKSNPVANQLSFEES